MFTYAKVHTCDFGEECRLSAGDDFYVADLDAGTHEIFGLYELAPGFLFSFVTTVVVSLLTKKPSADMLAEFDKVAQEV